MKNRINDVKAGRGKNKMMGTANSTVL